MTKIRRQKRRKRYNYDRNRKRMMKKLYKTPKIKCEPLKKQWNKFETVRQNMKDMGLAYDSNLAVKMPKQITMILSVEDEDVEERRPKKIGVQMELEEEATAPRQRAFKLPAAQVQWVTYLLDKYGEDYKAMARDEKNHYQETWKQLRAKVRQFKGINQQFQSYLRSRQLTTEQQQ